MCRRDLPGELTELQGYIRVVVVIDCSAFKQGLSTLLLCKFEYSVFMQVLISVLSGKFYLEYVYIYLYRYINTVISACECHEFSILQIQSIYSVLLNYFYNGG